MDRTQPTPERIYELTQTDPVVMAALAAWREMTGQPAPTPMVLVASAKR